MPPNGVIKAKRGERRRPVFEDGNQPPCADDDPDIGFATLERFRGRLGEANLRLVAHMEDPGWQASVEADPAAVEHVLFNLIDNATKYAAGSDPAEVTLEAEARGKDVKIRVRDHGDGIPRAEKKRIFRAFHKSAAAAAESRPGVGLGLSLSRRLARASGGDLKLEHGDRGACFTLTLPRARHGAG